MKIDQEFEQKVRSKRNKKRAAIAIVVVLILVTAAGVYARGRTRGAERTGTATIEIRCDQLAESPEALNDQALAAYVPADGVIAPRTTYPIVAGETTVADLTEEICRDLDIQIEVSGSEAYGGIYVESIGYLYEFSAGQYSGWMYRVNGESVNYGAGQCKLQDGDEVLWYYVIDFQNED